MADEMVFHACELCGGKRWFAYTLHRLAYFKQNGSSNAGAIFPRWMMLCH